MDILKEHAKMESIEQIGKWTSLNIGVAEFFVWFICVIFMGLAPVSVPGPSCSHWNTELLRQRSHLRRRIGLCSRQVHLQQDVMCEVHPKHRWDMLGHSRLWLENGGDPQLSTTINSLTNLFWEQHAIPTTTYSRVLSSLEPLQAGQSCGTYFWKMYRRPIGRNYVSDNLHQFASLRQWIRHNKS